MKPILLLLIPFLLFAQTYITQQSGIVGPTTGTGTYVFEQSGLVFNSSDTDPVLSFDSVSVKIDGAFHKLASGDSVYWLDTLLYSITGAEDWLSTIDSMYIGLIKQPVLSATDTTITLEIQEWLAPGWLQFSISDETTTDTCTDPDSVWMEADYRAPPAPVIDSIRNNPEYYGERISIYGSGFLSEQGTGFIVIEDDTLVDVEMWTDTHIIDTIPEDMERGYKELQINNNNNLTISSEETLRVLRPYAR